MTTNHELVVSSGIAVIIVIDNIKPQAKDVNILILTTTTVTIHDEANRNSGVANIANVVEVTTLLIMSGIRMRNTSKIKCQSRTTCMKKVALR